MKEFNSDFESITNDYRCLKTLFAHEASILCLVCNGQKTIDALDVDRELFRGRMFFSTTVLDTVVQNCQNMFKRIFKLVSILILGIYKMDESSEINLSMTNEGSKYLEFLYTLYKSMQECMVNQNCVHYVR